MDKQILYVALVLYFATFGCGIYFRSLYRQRLKKLNPELARELYPDTIPRSVVKRVNLKSKPMFFVTTRKYRSLNDPDFTKFCDRYRIFLFWWYFIFVATVIIFFGVKESAFH
jgi:hypothetical protein